MDLRELKGIFRTAFGRLDKAADRPLFSIQVELTNCCNYRCRFCPQSLWREAGAYDAPFDRPKGFMAFDLFRNVIDEAAHIAREVNFSFFGEPMMHPEFLRFMDYLKSRNPRLRVVMNTNLSLATREIFSKLIEIELGDLRLSIDAATAETYEQVRPGRDCIDLDGKRGVDNRFETICRKAEYWFALPGHRPTRHVFTVNSINRFEMRCFVERWLPLLGENDIILTKNVLTYGGKVSDELIVENSCNVWDQRMLTVDWTGKVSPCNLDTNMDLAIGSIKETSLLELYRSAKYQEIRELSKAQEINPCKMCVDANNWSKNTVFRMGDRWTDRCAEMYSDPPVPTGCDRLR